MKRHLLSLLVLASSAALTSNPTSAAEANIMQNNMVLCPSIHQLHLDRQQHWWATKTIHDDTSNDPNARIRYKWYSTTPSLAKGINYFAGAQYQGSSEGHVACLYMPKAAFHTQAFPIWLYLESLSLRPKGGKWKQDPKNSGQLNCISKNPSDCPYLIYSPDAIKDPYASLRELG